MWLVFPWCRFGCPFVVGLGRFFEGEGKMGVGCLFSFIVLFILARHKSVLCVGMKLILRWKPLNKRGGCKGSGPPRGRPLAAPSGGSLAEQPRLRWPAFPALERGGCSLCSRGNTLRADLLLPSVLAYGQMAARRLNEIRISKYFHHRDAVLWITWLPCSMVEIV